MRPPSGLLPAPTLAPKGKSMTACLRFKGTRANICPRDVMSKQERMSLSFLFLGFWFLSATYLLFRARTFGFGRTGRSPHFTVRLQYNARHFSEASPSSGFQRRHHLPQRLASNTRSKSKVFATSATNSSACAPYCFMAHLSRLDACRRSARNSSGLASLPSAPRIQETE